MTPEVIVRSGTSWEAVPFVPEITLLTAAMQVGLWELWDRTERDAPPFWAFPWAGGQALARYVLDHPGAVAGRHVLDVASGSGLVAIAAAKAGAASVIAGDVDPNAVTAIGINAPANAVLVAPRAFDLAADDARGADLVLAADVFYQRELAGLALSFLRRAARDGADVLVSDPGRAFLPAGALIPVTTYEVPVHSVLEDAPMKKVTVYRLALPAALRSLGWTQGIGIKRASFAVAGRGWIVCRLEGHKLSRIAGSWSVPGAVALSVPCITEQIGRLGAEAQRLARHAANAGCFGTPAGAQGSFPITVPEAPAGLRKRLLWLRDGGDGQSSPLPDAVTRGRPRFRSR
jgi:predicted nicotinamide N-methyase